MNRDFEKVVKEIDEMLLFREIDQLIIKHEKKTKEKKEIKSLIESNNYKPVKNLKSSDSKVEIFEFPTKKITKTIKVSC